MDHAEADENSLTMMLGPFLCCIVLCSMRQVPRIVVLKADQNRTCVEVEDMVATPADRQISIAN